MNLLSAAWTLACKDLKTFARDRTALILGFLVPIVLVTIFGWIMTFAFGGPGGMPKVTLWVIDEDQSPVSMKLIERLRQSDMLIVQPAVGSSLTREQLRTKIADGDASHGVVIPVGYEAQSAAGVALELEMLRDPGREMESQIIQIALMQALVADSDGTLWSNAVTRMLQDEGMPAGQAEALKFAFQGVNKLIGDFVQERSLEQSASTLEPSSSIDNAAQSSNATATKKPEDDVAKEIANPMAFFSKMVPVKHEDIVPPSRPKRVTYQQAQSVSGVCVMMLMFGLTGAGALLLAEREQGTLKRLFAMAIPRESVLVGKFIFISIIGIVQMIVLFIYAEIIFRIGFFRDPVTLTILVVTWVAVAGSFAMTIATFSKTAKQGDGLATILILAMAALGGCWFPVQQMNLPWPLEVLSKSTLTYWSMSGFQGLLWGNLSWLDSKMLLVLAIQWIWAGVLAAASAYLFRRNYCAG